MTQELDRREFLFRAGTGLSAAWLSANWPALLAAADHARHAAQSRTPAKLEFFTLEEAVEVDAITARIIPADDTPGAREAGVVYFIDRGRSLPELLLRAAVARPPDWCSGRY